MRKVIALIIALKLLVYCSSVFAYNPPKNIRYPTGGKAVNPYFEQNFDVDRGASRTSGVAPLSVHFTAGFNASSATDRGFHNYDYTWNFGDSTSGNWGTNGKPKNMAKGPVAAHVYETPGTYTATLSIRDASGVVDSDSFTITVSDPDVVYSVTNTTCISDTAHNDFSGCPVGATKVSTDDISRITNYVGPGRRVLLHRGSAWVSDGENFPDSTGPVSIGAYGACSSPDNLGICSNAPQINLTGAPANQSFIDISDKVDWRIMDLHLTGTTDYRGIWGAMDFQQNLIFRNKLSGFYTNLSWTHWKDHESDTINQMSIVENDLSNSYMWVSYVGSEKLAILGNRMSNSTNSHTLRIWQSYLGIVEHNIVSGAGTNVQTGRHCLKLFGPKQSEVALTRGLALDFPTSFTVLSDNVFGASGSWLVTMGPQDNQSDERLNDILFERNKVFTDYGMQNEDVQSNIRVWGRYFTLRNNIIVSTGNSTAWFTSIAIEQRGVEPSPMGHEIYNNTIYRGDNGTGSQIGISISSNAVDTIIRNNLFSFPNCSGSTLMISNSSLDLVSSNNLLTSTPGLVSPDDANPLLRDFSLQHNSPAIGQGIVVPVYDNFSGNIRTDSPYNISAF